MKKQCRQCKEVKPISLFTLQKQKGRIFIKSFCKKCMSERMKQWRLKNLEKFREYQREYSKRHSKKYKDFTLEQKEARKKYMREYYHKNK